MTTRPSMRPPPRPAPQPEPWPPLYDPDPEQLATLRLYLSARMIFEEALRDTPDDEAHILVCLQRKQNAMDLLYEAMGHQVNKWWLVDDVMVDLHQRYAGAVVRIYVKPRFSAWPRP